MMAPSKDVAIFFIQFFGKPRKTINIATYLPIISSCDVLSHTGQPNSAYIYHLRMTTSRGDYRVRSGSSKSNGGHFEVTIMRY